MTEHTSGNLLTGHRIRAALGITYVADETEDSSLEGLELLREAEQSIVLSCGTDWTLKVNEGNWPEMPAWCWPAESWAFREIEEIGSPGIDVITSTSSLFDSTGENFGILLEFSKAWVTVSSGESLTLEIKHKSSH
ncbi:hypothetical protein [Streptomyces lonarensis]|uniref:Uncharacterized protein n=1 Tax=Streptomyces lonarensis TaxID=700599 RepID=A0A7X6HXT1_9ACTN|nr:hypothetical protein [Streptomyces lonarensis]NJQ04891.1 hypothetical protein [Streptomyces lonarensis]